MKGIIDKDGAIKYYIMLEELLVYLKKPINFTPSLNSTFRKLR